MSDFVEHFYGRENEPVRGAQAMSDFVERLRKFDPETFGRVHAWEAADEIERLRAILRRLVDKIHDYERINNLAPNPGRTECWDEVEEARAALETKP